MQFINAKDVEKELAPNPHSSSSQYKQASSGGVWTVYIVVIVFLLLR